MHARTKVTGVVLAGGLARRMGGQDKGLVEYQGLPMILYPLRALASVADEVLINANRHQERYRRFGYPVISDRNGRFDGPLAGILSAMLHSEADILLVTPCDSPLIQPVHLLRLLNGRAEHDADIAVAVDGVRLHPVFLALKRALYPSLQEFLACGQRKVALWLERYDVVRIDFSRNPEIFLNINSFEELAGLEAESQR